MRVPCLCFSLIFCLATAPAQTEAIAAYVKPYLDTNNFSGVIVVEKSGTLLFQKAYGFADREKKLSNTLATQFHIASMSMQFTAASILRLIDQGVLRLDTPVAEFLPDTPGADKVTIQDLLIQRSGLADINELPDYDDILQHHQTPASLVARISGRPLLFAPGSQYLHEEHSAYNLLALIIEKKTGLPFAAAVRRLVFQPIGLDTSGVDDDSPAHSKMLARGYQPEGVYAVKPATAIHWSAKTGNASVYTTAADEAKWIRALFRQDALSVSARNRVLATSPRVGYGWFRGTNKQFGQTAYSMNGRSPGFASFVLYLPREELTVVLFSNIYSSATTAIGYDIASIALGMPYRAFKPGASTTSTGTFQFGPDFYQKNAKLELVATGSELSLRWPSGESTVLIPLSQDQFIDRAYWEPVKIERDASGKPVTLFYDQFSGAIIDRK